MKSYEPYTCNKTTMQRKVVMKYSSSSFSHVLFLMMTIWFSPLSAFCLLPVVSRSSKATTLLLSSTSSSSSLETRATQLMESPVSQKRLPNVKIAPVSTHRLGLVATERIPKGQVVLSLPCQNDGDEDFPVLTVPAAKQVFQDVLPDSFDSWTGDVGLLAMLLLYHVAQSANDNNSNNNAPSSSFRTVWLQALPTLEEMAQHHPYFWSEADQEILQMSSTNKIYQRLDDMEEDFGWWKKHVLEVDRKRFPEHVGHDKTPCFSWTGFRWAVAILQSRSFFLDGALRCIPLLDMCNHDDAAEEIRTSSAGGFLGMGGNKKNANAQLIADRTYEIGHEIFCSYGPKSAADYLLEHGFVPEQCWKTAVSELTFELDPNDRFRDDKLDILEFETYDQAPMDPIQTFDVVSSTAVGTSANDGSPDPAMMQFLRLCKLGSTDAFLLESIFRKDIWGFMALPVSEQNELAVVNTISETCQRALDEFSECASEGGPEVCTKLRQAETRALSKTIAFVKREKEALDLKEYYQERRLRDLGLDSEWAPEDEDMVGEDMSFGQTRAPGGADYDW